MTKIGQRRRSTNRPPTDAGICELCTADVTRWTSARHLAQCAPAYDTPSAPLQTLLQFRATSPGLPAYWIDFEAKADTTLKAVDAFLRRIWLECCGHLSAFHIGGVDYFSEGYEFGLSGGFGSRAAERSMNVRLREALPLTGRRFDYEYDFGSTTRIKLQLTGERPGRIRRPLVAPAGGKCRSRIRVCHVRRTRHAGLLLLCPRGPGRICVCRTQRSTRMWRTGVIPADRELPAHGCLRVRRRVTRRVKRRCHQPCVA